MNLSKKLIFWDWNGTLLNDAMVCVEAMNAMLKKRGRSVIDFQFYQSVFDFPVINYYKKLGFNLNKEPFKELSKEFLSNYNELVHLASLQPYSIKALEYFKRQGVQQVIISAMEQKMLFKQVKQFKVAQYFNAVRGIGDIFANGKTHLARDYMDENKLEAKDLLFIGDTLHDVEVADELGISIFLVANGHHSFERLAVNGNMVFKDLKSFPIMLYFHKT